MTITFIWAGLVIGISFIEAPLKFQAPGITLELGLGIGKIVFGALTTIEIVISILSVLFLYLIKEKRKFFFLFAIPVVIVVIDNIILLPILNERLDLIVNGTPPPASYTHWYYIVLEIIKLVFLILSGVFTAKHFIK
jgi:hypothetical protein